MPPTPGLPCLTSPNIECGYGQFCCGQADPTIYSCVTDTTGGSTWQATAPCPEGGCGGGGELTSPNYPSKYPSRLDRTDVIVVDQGLVIAIKFTAFDVENNSKCNYDDLTITEGDGTPLMAKACGSTLPSDLTSTTATVRVNFKTDGGGTKSGWRLEWTAVSPGVTLLYHLKSP